MRNRKEDSWDNFYEELRNIEAANQASTTTGQTNTPETDYDEIKGLSAEQVGHLADDLRTDLDDIESPSDESTTTSS